MKYLKTTHYVANSFEGKPSFVIVLQDEKLNELSFISNGCQFVELNEKNIKKLIRAYDCESYIDELLESPINSDDEIIYASQMFYNADMLKKVELSLPQATDCYSLLRGCTNLEKVELSLPQATDCSYLLEGCSNLEKVELSLPQATDCYSLLRGCTFNKDLITFNWI